MKNKKIPMRLCVGCGEMKPKKDLIRVLRDAEGNIQLDFTGKKSGRGAYLCRSLKCLETAQKRHRLERSFGCGCQIPENIYKEMEHALQKELTRNPDHLS